MSEQLTVSRGTSTRNRNDDPIKIDRNHRLSYWTSGKVGVGERRQVRHRTREDAEATANTLRAEFAAVRAPATTAELHVVMRAFVQKMRADDRPNGSVNKYRSAWNTWLQGPLGTVRCCDLNMTHYVKVVDSLTEANASVSVMKSVFTTLGALVNFAAPRGFLVQDQPFGPGSQLKPLRLEALKAARRRARNGITNQRIDLESCPTPEGIEAFADALEVLYPSYGRRLVLLAYASGLRIGELLALRTEHVLISDDKTELSVVAQLDRYKPFPAITPPKGDKGRTTIVWDAYRPELEWLVADATARRKDNGWLFPRYNSETLWLDHIGHLLTQARTEIGWAWTMHWTRHAFASVSLAPESAGGYGLDLASVSRWLGHAQTSTTMDRYVAPQSDDAEVAKKLTARRPGVTKAS